MAEFLFKDIVKKKGLEKEFYIDSKATSREEIGNGIHYGTKRILNSLGIDCSNKRASQMTKSDYDYFDYIILMDHNNLYNVKRIINSDPLGKVHLLLDYTDIPRDISDPWYTGDFNKTYSDIIYGLNGFLKYLLKD